MTLQLRPHHILSLQQYMKVGANKESKHRSYLKEVYGETFLKGVDHIAEELFINNDEPITLIKDSDEICTTCKYQEDCAEKNYSKLHETSIKSAEKYFNKKLSSEESFTNPEVLDFLSTEVYNLQIGKTYTINELFKLLEGE